MSARPSSPPFVRTPVRTCIGCRRRTSPEELLRVVAVAGTIVPDPRHRLPGRGAWLHPDLGCFDAAERRRAFGRSLRATRALDLSMVRRHLSGPASLGVEPDSPEERTAAHPVRTATERREQVEPS